MNDPQQPTPTPAPPTHAAQTQPTIVVQESLPWFLKIFASPTTLANVIAFGASLLLLYTAAVEWPRQTERFHDRMQEQRDATREAVAAQKENQRLVAENQRLLTKIEAMEERQAVTLEGIKKVLTEMWFKIQALEKAKGMAKEEEPPPPFAIPPP